MLGAGAGPAANPTPALWIGSIPVSQHLLGPAASMATAHAGSGEPGFSGEADTLLAGFGLSPGHGESISPVPSFPVQNGEAARI